MSELFSQLGINWKLLVSQGVNFFIVLAVLTLFVWRPLLNVIRSRRAKIEKGLRDAEEAAERLKNADVAFSKRMTEAEREAFTIIQRGEEKAKEKSAGIVQVAKKKAEEVLREAAEVARGREEEEFQKFAEGAGFLLREALAKAVSENPRAIDEKLIGDAVSFIKKHKAA